MRLVVCVGGVVVDAIALILSDDVARRGSKIWRGAWGVLWHVRCFSITVFTYSIVIVVLNVVCVFEDWSIMRYWRSHVAHRQCHSDVSPARMARLHRQNCENRWHVTILHAFRHVPRLKRFESMFDAIQWNGHNML